MPAATTVADTLAWNLPCLGIMRRAQQMEDCCGTASPPTHPPLGLTGLNRPPKAVGSDTTTGCLAIAIHPAEWGDPAGGSTKMLCIGPHSSQGWSGLQDHFRRLCCEPTLWLSRALDSIHPHKSTKCNGFITSHLFSLFQSSFQSPELATYISKFPLQKNTL